MAIPVNFSGAPAPGVTFSVGSGTVAQLLKINPTLPISLPATGLAADNLTFIGVFAPAEGSNTVWRISNLGPDVPSATLSKLGGGYSTTLSLPANSFTFVRAGTTGTYQLTIGSATFTKAAGTTTISLGNPPAPAGQTTVSRLNILDSYIITGSNFNDNLTGGNNSDTITGGAGNDTLNGLNFADSLNGEAGSDILSGGSGNDIVVGGTESDTLFGGTGNDTLFGNDSLTGGPGFADRFAYATANEGVDTIRDFSTAELDLIQISASGTGFSGSGLTPGLLPGTQFFSSSTAGPGSGNAATRFIYNTTSGNLWFDRDGTGATASVQLATLTGAPAAFDHSYIAIVA